MKNLLFFAAVVAPLAARPAVFTVSQSPNLPAQYTTIPDAINAASAGDTVYIHASAQWYTPWVSLDKRVVLIGTGPHPRSVSGQNVTIQNFEFRAGASGSVVEGLVFVNNVQTAFVSNSTILNLHLKNNYFNGILNIGCGFNSFIVENCIFVNGSLTFHSQGDPYRSGLVIRNNIFSTWGSSGDVSVNHAGDNAVIDHNLFIGSQASIRAFGTLYNCTVSNNIFYFRTIDSSGSYANTGCVFLNNITYQCTNTLPLPGNSGSGNMAVDPQFVNFPLAPTQFTYAYDFHTLAGSLAHNAATDGTDIGLYGGVINYSKTGEPAGLPVMRQLDIYNATVPSNGTLDIRMKASVPVRD